jgi:hypothetical protein
MQHPLSHFNTVAIVQGRYVPLAQRATIHTGRVAPLIHKKIFATKALHLSLYTRNVLIRIGQSQCIGLIAPNAAYALAKHR